MSPFSIWLEAMRPKTLPAAVVPVLLASSLAYADGAFDWRAALICVAFALMIQIGTNFANDYLDGIKGTDTEARIGPQRAVATGLVAPKTMKRATISVLLAGFCVGLGLIPFGGWWLLLIGVSSVVCAWLYTGGPYPLAYNGLGDVFVVLFFGFIAVGCTYYVQVGTISPEVVLLGLGCGVLVNNILVVNNYRDIEEDRLARKRTLVVIMGRRIARLQYDASALLAAVVVLCFWAMGYGVFVFVAWLPVGYALILGHRLAAAEGAHDFLEALKGSAKVVAAYGLLFSAGLLAGAVVG
jgi:1,4-dihydroxy-2-naphthoate octaprenyltransferase